MLIAQKLLERIDIMSLLGNLERNLSNGEKVLKLEARREMEIFSLLIPVSAHRVVTNKNLSHFLLDSLNKASYEYLSRYKNREIFSIDCKGMTNADALGTMATIAKMVKKTPDMVIVINNIAEIYDDPNCENPQYVENLLGHSWKNDRICFDKYEIDARKFTVILTATPEYKDVLGQKYRADSYLWHGDFDQKMEEIEEQLKSL